MPEWGRALQGGWMVLGRGVSARSSRQGWEPDWSRVAERAGSGERNPGRGGAGLTGVGLRGGPRRTFAELRSLGTTLGTRRDEVSGGLGRRI